MKLQHILLPALLASGLVAQQRLWQAAGPNRYYITADPFFDYDGDGQVDLLVGLAVDYPFNPRGVLRILSGTTGATLFENASSAGLRVVGDMDGDGQRDYVTYGVGSFYNRTRLSVRSWPTGQVLWQAEGQGHFGYSDQTSLTADLDLTGDGRPDLVVVSDGTQDSALYAYDNGGTLLYQVTLYTLGWIANNVTAMPDLDGDGCHDFLVGCIEPSGRGAVVVVSGRTGAVLRISYGVLPGDYIGGTVCNAGDVDQDGMADYAAASYWSSPLLSIVIFSGRTGAVLHNWTDYFALWNGMIGNVDVDLDGVPDLIVGSGNQIRAYSGRDFSTLWNFDRLGSNDTLSPWPVFNLGASPTNPYPKLGCIDNAYREGQSSSVGRVIVFGSGRLGSGAVTGSACSNTTNTPQIGLRTVGPTLRLTVSGGPPGALAWLVGAHASQTAFEGVALPFALDPFGLFGCMAYVPPVAVVPTVLGTAGLDRGYAGIDLPWPALSTTGTAFAAQWLLLDPATGAYAVSARHEFTGR